MNPTLHIVSAVVLLLAFACAGHQSRDTTTASSGPSVELRILKVPSPAFINGKAHLAHELLVENRGRARRIRS